MNFFKFILQFFTNKTEPKSDFPSGVLEDNRSDENKKKDFWLSELILGGPVEWKSYEYWKSLNSTIALLKSIEPHEQDGSGSCVACSGAMILGLQNFFEENNFLSFSARDIYARKGTKEMGMIFQVMADILINRGATFEHLLPSNLYNEEGMNKLDDYHPSYELIGKIYKAANWFNVATDIDSIAYVLAQNKPVVIGFSFLSSEWSKQVPTISGQNTNCRHAVVALPNGFFMYQGKKAIIVQDSWDSQTSDGGRRILTEDWFKGRAFASICFENLNNFAIINKEIVRPQYYFNHDLTLGMTDPDVSQLQKCLAYLQDSSGYLFPLAQQTTNYFGGITRQAVIRFQKMNNISQTGNVGPLTRDKLNELFQ